MKLYFGSAVTTAVTLMIAGLLGFMGYTPHPVVTLGKVGCAYWHDGSIRYVSAIDEFRAVDTTGAGDNFLTGIIYGLLTEEPLDRCVRLGNIFAGKSTTAVGCFGAALILLAAIAAPLAKTQHTRQIWFYVMSGGALLKILTMEISRILL